MRVKWENSWKVPCGVWNSSPPLMMTCFLLPEWWQGFSSSLSIIAKCLCGQVVNFLWTVVRSFSPQIQIFLQLRKTFFSKSSLRMPWWEQWVPGCRCSLSVLCIYHLSFHSSLNSDEFLGALLWVTPSLFYPQPPGLQKAQICAICVSVNVWKAQLQSTGIFNPLFIILFLCGDVYWQSHSLQQKASQTSHQTTSCHVLFTSYFIFMWIFPSRNVTTISWGLYCQGLGILYAQFTLYWNFNFTRSDFCCVLGSPHLLENYETCHISARCFFLFCSQFGLFVSICLMFVCKNNQKTFVVYVNTEHNSNLFHMRFSD